ncbi:PAS domain S-box protein [Gemmata sp. G18]|uniref:Oxygen sensor histidine kinase NreB n=1 Tax=Gemmata palustris TaxID=2822762 RepID=A0ABS5BTF5_9BACT|nr:PAS domain-containing sensor histidine kinase [Gemmata palustris]MBP3957002.1 PAS domain S-box protein [Gemmata palustris]
MPRLCGLVLGAIAFLHAHPAQAATDPHLQSQIVVPDPGDGTGLRGIVGGFREWHVIGIGLFCLIEALLIAGLLIRREARVRTDEWFRQVVETAPTGMLMVDRDGTVLLANAQAEALFGSGRGDLLGRPADRLVPEHLLDRFSTGRAKFVAAPPTLSGTRIDTFARRQDGSTFPVEIGLSAIRTPRGAFVLVAVTDRTECRRVKEELRASQQEQRVLTGHLLEAQEAERRRIARELHDDLNQSLALLSIEMELLACVPPTSATQTAQHLREFAARVKDLSSSVHALSHQLHPSKLEHLGLVAALKGLCKELNHAHGLIATFSHDAVPESVPADVALCMYRIAQEALWNVVKHSGTRGATVELRGSANTIRLRVSDDGAGFDLSAVSAGLGLVSMRERLNLVGGEFVIDSRPAGGTRIEARVPVPVARVTEPEPELVSTAERFS